MKAMVKTPVNSDLPSPTAMKRSIINDLGRDVLDRKPWQMLLYIPILGAIAAASSLIVLYDLSLVTYLFLSLVLALAYGAAVFLAHEALHGSIVKSKTLQNLMGYFGFSLFLVSPHLWRVWHNRNHHGHTNQGNRDPDSFGTLDRYHRVKSTRFVTSLAPGSGSPLSYLFLFYWFTFHGQVVLWIQSKYMQDFKGMNRGRAISDSMLMLCFWGWIAYLAGPYKAVFVLVIPMMLANFTIMSYIATNHFLMPQDSHPLRNSMGIKSHPIWDVLHFNFSHHVEHHMFPTMNWQNFPKLREWFLRNYPEEYVAPSHGKALMWLYKTPRVYRKPDILCDPEGRREDITISSLHPNLGH